LYWVKKYVVFFTGNRRKASDSKMLICVKHDSTNDEMGRACSTNGEKRNAYRILVGNPEGRPRRRWVDNIKMDLSEIGWDGMD
jgi:hypothetical protein